MIGRTIGRFHITGLLGRGGMSSVWKASDGLLGRSVAIKILDEAIARIPVSRRRFRREAEIAALLEHPCIVPIYEAGESGETAYLVMKLIEGETLAQFTARRLQPIDEVLRIGASVADALAYAHGHGVVHRDMSPRNIMLGDGGAVYVLDFGLASVAGQTKSTSGNIKGTAAYLSPETLSGRATDARSDIYSLGVVLYEALTGTTPFQGEQQDALGYAILHGDAEPPSALRPEVGADIDGVVMRALSRDPAARYADAGEFGATLKRLRTPVAAPAPALDPRAGVADRLAGGNAPRPDGSVLAGRARSLRPQTYLAVLPVETQDDGATAGDRRRMLDGIAEAARAGLAQMDRLHVVAADPLVPGEDPRTFARRVGANLLLRSTARFAGGAVRITFAVLDPERETQVAGGNVDGSVFDPFALEDRLVASVRTALGTDAEETWRARPHDPAAREHFAQALAYLRRFDHPASVDGAIALLEGLLATEGEAAVIHATMARACLHKYRHTKQRVWESRAVQACERAAGLDHSLPEVMQALGEMHATAGRYEQALAELDRAVETQPDFYEAHLSRARALDGANRTPEAEQACRRAIALRPEDWRAHHVLGLILFRHGHYADAIEPWRHVTDLTPDNATGYRNLGGALFRLDRDDEAIAAYRRASEIRPHAEALWNLGSALFYLGRYDESIEAFEKAVALNPSDAFAWGNLGSACRQIPGREARMREALERAIALTKDRLDRGPGEAEDWSRLANWLEGLGRKDEAECAVRHAIAMAPDDVNCMAEAGKVLLSLGARSEGLGLLRRAVESGYGVDSLRRSPVLRAWEGDAELRRILERGSPATGVAEDNGIEKERP